MKMAGRCLVRRHRKTYQITTQMKPTQLNINSPDFDYCEWIQTATTKEEFLAIWQQFTEKEKAAVLADYQRWLVANR